ncbi:MAG TPA: PfaD family polyunsaturated fatty acid/polyketide biosynthesis protein [Gammaproteobacteria bacterium]
MAETSLPHFMLSRSSPQAGAGGQSSALGWWHREGGEVLHGVEAVHNALLTLHQPVCLVRDGDRYGVTRGGSVRLGIDGVGREDLPVVGYAARLMPQQLGDPGFCGDHGVDYAYMAGAMANGIASPELVESLSRAGLLSSYGAAGKSIEEIDRAIERISSRLAGRPYCFNLIHSPAEPLHEARTVELYLHRGIRVIEASAYLDLTLPVVRYRVTGLYQDPEGRVVAPNRIIAKASRVEVARKWLSPPPPKMLAALVDAGEISQDQAALAAHIPMAQDLTAEADSGGHTDNRPAVTLIPTFLALRNRLQAEHGYADSLRIGAAGGIGTPNAAAAAFAMGAAYIATGTVNQACIESGSSDLVRRMLAESEQADVIMAPAADMFEMGVKLQVLKRGTLFPMRASKLYELYSEYDSLDDIPANVRDNLERTVFRASIADIWSRTREFFSARDPTQVARAETDPRHKMALVFRWYLGHSSRWANDGDASRQADYQVWCGPAMGAFNEWVRGSFLESPENRKVVTIAHNVLFGAAVLTRINVIRSQGTHLDADWVRVAPLTPEILEGYLN